MTTNKNKPAKTLRDGNLKATIWRNESEKGVFYSTNFSRSYKDSAGDYHDTDSYSNGELLKLSHLAIRAYDAETQLRIVDNKKAGAQ